ncbi:MAG: hypothetical protein L3J75_04660 [Methylococcaceae bacterium]|nr:hypothetical protein [Methylococcaceae bacterium]
MNMLIHTVWSRLYLILPLFLLSACHIISEKENTRRTVFAEVVALDQALTYNRFGSFNPYGMIYALKRDVVDTDSCDAKGLNCRPMDESTKPGHVRLRMGKRPRPLVLRVNEGDLLKVKFYNMLIPHQPDASSKETTSRIPSKQFDSLKSVDLHYANLGKAEKEIITLAAEGVEFTAKIEGAAANPLLAGIDGANKYCAVKTSNGDGLLAGAEHGNDWPKSRCASITLSGIAAVSTSSSTQNNIENGLVPIAPGETQSYQWLFDSPKKDQDGQRKQAYLFFSHGAPAGGQGDGGSLVHGLFGVVNVEPADSTWYRSQVTSEVWNKVWITDPKGNKTLDYSAKFNDGTPALNMLQSKGNNEFEIIYGDLNAIIHEGKFSISSDQSNPRKAPAFREFTVVFHDELKTFYADEFVELGSEYSLSGVADGFAVNYGASGMGAILLANRKGIGPSKDCVECAYEEFFLESWVNGDPALLSDYSDDPSNVHHSYLNDRLVFRNLHAGPKETHVFHLHAHQWLAQDGETGTYLDSQTIAPQQGFSYEIYYGGSGNRNETPGDSIFHCHLYPHFAQGMWELWRVHDVLEDGSRRLPDGELSGVDGYSGTHPLTGKISKLAFDNTKLSGTPIPAIVPLPEQAMPPYPTYLNDGIAAERDGFPGYPFYIAGDAGHRTPQAPLDIDKSGGLDRHLIQCPKNAAGESICQRTVSGIPAQQLKSMSGKQVIEHALKTADFSIEMEQIQVKLLPADGTKLEQIAMDFHQQGKIDSTTPQGKPAELKVNGSEPKAGAPFSDPCQGWTFESETFGDRTRQYHVSAIQTDMVVNKAGWHDPQARINVLDEDVDEYEHKRVEHAVPFFFRANSGDCIEFYHTNRTHHNLELDDFQVKTPTDIIGQHIHLVKFDVTASDGSGNGFNYEDGTFSRGAIVERIKAAKGRTFNENDSVTLHQPATDEFQTTIQRWYVDPLLAKTSKCKKLAGQNKAGWKNDPACYDRTIRTVFTHDHFAPSSIQQHGFYSALLVEPRYAEMQHPDGTNMDAENKYTKCKPGQQPDGTFKSCAVGTQAMVIINDDGSEYEGEKNYREFALAVADFALLYDNNKNAEPKGLKGYQQLSANKQQTFAQLNENLKHWQSQHGHPVDPPKLPEAISKNHHNPYLVNYKHEPLPLRIGCNNYKNESEFCTSQSVKQQRSGDEGDMAYAFSSWKHGDPATEIFAGYEGEKVQLRVIQGAQEVQHSLNIHGQRWPREIGNPKSPLVSAQEIGISEHFEMKLGLDNVTRGDPFVDYMYNFGSVDDLWNGAWGMIRNFKGYLDCDSFAKDSSDLEKCQSAMAKLNCKSKKLKNCLKPLPNIERNENGNLLVNNRNEFVVGGDNTCPKNATRHVTFYIDAVDISQWLGDEKFNTAYDSQLRDPDSLAFILLDRKINKPDQGFPSPKLREINTIKKKLAERYRQQQNIEPLVLRANAGDCIQVVLYNHLHNHLAKEQIDKVGDALMPKIVPLNVEADAISGSSDVKPSSMVTIHPQLVAHNVATQDGAAIGFNNEGQLVPGMDGRGNPFRVYYWYAGTVEIEAGELVAKPRELGAINLVSFGDIVNHPPHGLFGALIIEPENTTYHHVETGELLAKGDGVRAEIRYREQDKKKPFKEFVVFYRDGMNLHYLSDDGQSIPVPNCPICDDSYDRGEKGINYNSAPFWLRLGQKPQQPADATGTQRWFLPDLNGAYFPRIFFSEDDQPVPTPKFVAREGDEVRFRVLQPAGRARQRSFLVYGHDFPDLLTYFGSPHAPLMSVGKAITADIKSAKPGHWLYRDGPNHFWSGGAWGVFDVEPVKSQ